MKILQKLDYLEVPKNAKYAKPKSQIALPLTE